MALLYDTVYCTLPYLVPGTALGGAIQIRDFRCVRAFPRLRLILISLIVVANSDNVLPCGATHSCCALSLRNLVAGYECGRVFPAGAGPGSPSRDAVNWLPSRFSLLAETRRRYGWLRMVFPCVRLFRAPIWCLCEGGGTREAGSTVVESLVVLYRVGIHQIRRRRRAARSSTSQGRAEPLSARIKGASREIF